MNHPLYLFLLNLALSPVSVLAQRDAWIRHSSEPIALASGSRVEFVTMTSEAVDGEAFYSVFLPPSYGSGDANNPLELARKADLDGLAIYFDYGTADRYNRSVGLGAGNQRLDQALSKSGVDHVFREHEGEPHGWALVYAHIPESLGFLAEHLAP